MICLHGFVKVYEYRKTEDTKNLVSVLKNFIPTLHSAMVNFATDYSDVSQVLQNLVLKILFAFVNFHFPLDIMDKEVCLYSII